jgi:hypothetical protein
MMAKKSHDSRSRASPTRSSFSRQLTGFAVSRSGTAAQPFDRPAFRRKRVETLPAPGHPVPQEAQGPTGFLLREAAVRQVRDDADLLPDQADRGRQLIGGELQRGLLILEIPPVVVLICVLICHAGPPLPCRGEQSAG